jgi:Protein of unknown function (DUF2971)
MILYKYLPPARLDVLRDRRVRFTQPGDFNDPFEFRPLIVAAKNKLTRRAVRDDVERLLDKEFTKYLLGPLCEIFKEAMMDQEVSMRDILRHLDLALMAAGEPLLDHIINRSVGVLCLSEVRDSLLMWGHYTDNHRGFVVGFDSDHPFFSKRKTDQHEFGFLRRVDYRRERPSVVLSDTSSPAWFQNKSVEWAYEKEWRITRLLLEADHRIENSAFPICLFEFPGDCVLEIILGMRSTPELKREMENVISNFPKATLRQAHDDPSEYALYIPKVEYLPGSDPKMVKKRSSDRVK